MKPKYLFLKEALLAQIRSGLFARDTMIPSELELSEKHKISRNTVRQALQELENEGYLYRLRGKGTFVRSDGSVNARKIALLIYDTDDLRHSVTIEMIAGLSELLEQAGFILDILASHRTFQDENITRLAENYAGFVIATYRLDELTVAELNRLAIPHIFVKNYLPNRNDPGVRIDFVQAGFLAASHLIDCGCKNLGLVYPGRHIPIAADFFDGVCSAALENGVRLKKECLFATESYVCDKVKCAAETLAGNPARPEGVVAASDTTAKMLLETFRENGLHVPNDIMLVGCNDTSGLAAMTSPPLTTIRLPMREAGRATARGIIAMIRGDEPESLMLSPELVIRQSTIKRG
jgi:GntR family transcriptional regulator of arabinose operon